MPTPRFLAVLALGLTVAAASPVAAQEQAVAPPGPAPLRASPFRYLDVLRLDLRPESPLSELATLATLAVPVDLGPAATFAVLATYRYDRLRPAGHSLAVQERSLHRFELGAPMGFQLAPEWALELDLRVVHASALDAPHGGGWYPNVRAGVAWAPTADVAASVAVLFTRTGLGLIPVPLLGVYWRPRHLPVRIDALLPRYVELGYALTSSAELFLAGHWETLIWSVRSGEREALLTRQELRVDAGVRVRVLGPLGLEISGRWAPFQEVALEGPRSRPRSLDDLSLTVALVFDRVFAADNPP